MNERKNEKSENEILLLKLSSFYSFHWFSLIHKGEEWEKFIRIRWDLTIVIHPPLISHLFPSLIPSFFQFRHFHQYHFNDQRHYSFSSLLVCYDLAVVISSKERTILSLRYPFRNFIITKKKLWDQLDYARLNLNLPLIFIMLSFLVVSFLFFLTPIITVQRYVGLKLSWQYYQNQHYQSGYLQRLSLATPVMLSSSVATTLPSLSSSSSSVVSLMEFPKINNKTIINRNRHQFRFVSEIKLFYYLNISRFNINELKMIWVFENSSLTVIFFSGGKLEQQQHDENDYGQMVWYHTIYQIILQVTQHHGTDVPFRRWT